MHELPQETYADSGLPSLPEKPASECDSLRRSVGFMAPPDSFEASPVPQEASPSGRTVGCATSLMKFRATEGFAPVRFQVAWRQPPLTKFDPNGSFVTTRIHQDLYILWQDKQVDVKAETHRMGSRLAEP